jgi:protein involved in polysaccharide export with SLBB domain
VEGEVAAPGIYQVEAGETLPQLLARLGGVTPNAYLYGTEFTRESVRQQQQKNLDSVIRKLESQLQAEIGKQLSDANAKAEAQDQLLSQQQQLERMKTFKSNGRVSLELPPTHLTLDAIPALPLEDGDTIHIPSRPGFVTAVGEVYNENAIIYRSGRTVGDVLEAAGVSDNAELHYAFVLRADGSVKAARDNRSLFSLGGFEDIQMMPGDTVVVPAKLDRRTNWTKFVTGLKDWTQVLYQLGLGVAAWEVLK